MKWVTRERPKIDRIACPWLIQRFIDTVPVFRYVPSSEVLRVASDEGATLYDIVRGADTSRLDLTPQSAGLYAISLGLFRCYTDDHEMLKHGRIL